MNIALVARIGFVGFKILPSSVLGKHMKIFLRVANIQYVPRLHNNIPVREVIAVARSYGAS